LSHSIISECLAINSQLRLDGRKPRIEFMRLTAEFLGILSDGEVNAELLVYLVDEEKDIYIGVRPLPPRTCPAGLCPAESLSYLGVAESLRTGKWRPRRGLYKRTEIRI
jgi:hypothetical protein